MRNPRLWQPAEGRWEGYRVVEEDIVVTLEAFGMSIARKGLRTRALRFAVMASVSVSLERSAGCASPRSLSLSHNSISSDH